MQIISKGDNSQDVNPKFVDIFWKKKIKMYVKFLLSLHAKH